MCLGSILQGLARFVIKRNQLRHRFSEFVTINARDRFTRLTSKDTRLINGLVRSSRRRRNSSGNRPSMVQIHFRIVSRTSAMKRDQTSSMILVWNNKMRMKSSNYFKNTTCVRTSPVMRNLLCLFPIRVVTRLLRVLFLAIRGRFPVRICCDSTRVFRCIVLRMVKSRLDRVL